MPGKVLILDNLSLWSRFAAKTLLAHGYNLVELGSQEEAEALLEKGGQPGEEYALVIVGSLSDRTEDPRVKPLEIARRIAKIYPEVPLIVASSRPTPYQAVLAYEIGALDYIPKTCDETQLTESLEKVTHRANSRS